MLFWDTLHDSSGETLYASILQVFGERCFTAEIVADLYPILRKVMPIFHKHIKENKMQPKTFKYIAEEAMRHGAQKGKPDSEQVLVFEAAYIILLQFVPAIREELYTSFEPFHERYPEFINSDEVDEVEQMKLLLFRNMMIVALKIIPAKFKKTHLLDLVCRISEGNQRKYCCGGGQSSAVDRRVLIYEREGNVSKQPRAPRWNEIVNTLVTAFNPTPTDEEGEGGSSSSSSADVDTSVDAEAAAAGGSPSPAEIAQVTSGVAAAPAAPAASASPSSAESCSPSPPDSSATSSTTRVPGSLVVSVPSISGVTMPPRTPATVRMLHKQTSNSSVTSVASTTSTASGPVRKISRARSNDKVHLTGGGVGGSGGQMLEIETNEVVDEDLHLRVRSSSVRMLQSPPDAVQRSRQQQQQQQQHYAAAKLDPMAKVGIRSRSNSINKDVAEDNHNDQADGGRSRGRGKGRGGPRAPSTGAKGGRPPGGSSTEQDGGGEGGVPPALPRHNSAGGALPPLPQPSASAEQSELSSAAVAAAKRWQSMNSTQQQSFVESLGEQRGAMMTGEEEEGGVNIPMNEMQRIFMQFSDPAASASDYGAPLRRGISHGSSGRSIGSMEMMDPGLFSDSNTPDGGSVMSGGATPGSFHGQGRGHGQQLQHQFSRGHYHQHGDDGSVEVLQHVTIKGDDLRSLFSPQPDASAASRLSSGHSSGGAGGASSTSLSIDGAMMAPVDDEDSHMGKEILELLLESGVVDEDDDIVFTSGDGQMHQSQAGAGVAAAGGRGAGHSTGFNPAAAAQAFARHRTDSNSSIGSDCSATSSSSHSVRIEMNRNSISISKQSFLYPGAAGGAGAGFGNNSSSNIAHQAEHNRSRSSSSSTINSMWSRSSAGVGPMGGNLGGGLAGGGGGAAVAGHAGMLQAQVNEAAMAVIKANEDRSGALMPAPRSTSAAYASNNVSVGAMSGTGSGAGVPPSGPPAPVGSSSPSRSSTKSSGKNSSPQSPKSESSRGRGKAPSHTARSGTSSAGVAAAGDAGAAGGYAGMALDSESCFGLTESALNEHNEGIASSSRSSNRGVGAGAGAGGGMTQSSSMLSLTDFYRVDGSTSGSMRSSSAVGGGPLDNTGSHQRYFSGEGGGAGTLSSGQTTPFSQLPPTPLGHAVPSEPANNTAVSNNNASNAAPSASAAAIASRQDKPRSHSVASSDGGGSNASGNGSGGSNAASASGSVSGSVQGSVNSKTSGGVLFSDRGIFRYIFGGGSGTGSTVPPSGPAESGIADDVQNRRNRSLTTGSVLTDGGSVSALEARSQSAEAVDGGGDDPPAASVDEAKSVHASADHDADSSIFSLSFSRLTGGGGGGGASSSNGNTSASTVRERSPFSALNYGSSQAPSASAGNLTTAQQAQQQSQQSSQSASTGGSSMYLWRRARSGSEGANEKKPKPSGSGKMVTSTSAANISEMAEAAAVIEPSDEASPVSASAAASGLEHQPSKVKVASLLGMSFFSGSKGGGDGKPSNSGSGSTSSSRNNSTSREGSSDQGVAGGFAGSNPPLSLCISTAGGYGGGNAKADERATMLAAALADSTSPTAATTMMGFMDIGTGAGGGSSSRSSSRSKPSAASGAEVSSHSKPAKSPVKQMITFDTLHKQLRTQQQYQPQPTQPSGEPGNEAMPEEMAQREGSRRGAGSAAQAYGVTGLRIDGDEVMRAGPGGGGDAAAAAAAAAGSTDARAASQFAFDGESSSSLMKSPDQSAFPLGAGGGRGRFDSNDTTGAGSAMDSIGGSGGTGGHRGIFSKPSSHQSTSMALIPQDPSNRSLNSTNSRGNVDLFGVDTDFVCTAEGDGDEQGTLGLPARTLLSPNESSTAGLARFSSKSSTGSYAAQASGSSSAQPGSMAVSPLMAMSEGEGDEERDAAGATIYSGALDAHNQLYPRARDRLAERADVPAAGVDGENDLAMEEQA